MRAFQPRLDCVSWPILIAALALIATAGTASEPAIEIWHGDHQRVGHLGDAQDDFNLLGHVEPWRDIDTLEYSVNGLPRGPLSFRAFRRLVSDGDFNADIPIDQLRQGANSIAVTARFRDGRMLVKTTSISKEEGSCPLPRAIRWKDVKNPQEIGQYVDGQWIVTTDGLRTAQVGYDRVFLIGERAWRDYDAQCTITIHEVQAETPAASGGNGVGLIARFAGHSVDRPRNSPPSQPKSGHRPLGGIGWLRWKRGDPKSAPQLQFYPGAGDVGPIRNHGEFAVALGESYALRLRSRTLPDHSDGRGVTSYYFKIWPVNIPEPPDWTWEQVQVSGGALRTGGLALLLHHVDVTFGDVIITEITETAALDGG